MTRRQLLWKLYKFNFRLSLTHKLMGLDISRCFEYLTACEAIQKRGRGKLLDIGSYRSFLPLFFASEGITAIASDIHPSLRNQKTWMRRVKPAQPVHLTLSDTTRQGFKEDSFEYITCISTIEHIPANGDMLAVKEMARLLKPGGILFISVPYDRKMKEGRWGRWFQRDYDEQAVFERLVIPSGLQLEDKGYLLGYPTRQFADFLYAFMPRLIRHGLGWLQILAGMYYLERDRPTAENARIAWVVLTKPQR